MRVRTIVDPTFEGLVLTVAAPLGSADESQSHQGIAHLAEHIITKELESTLSGMTESEFFACAKTFVFHTEFSVWFPDDVANGSELLDVMLDAIRRPKYTRTDLVNQQLRIIAREVDLRKGRSSEAVLPWSFAPSIFKAGYAKHNTFVVDYSNATHVVSQIDEWKSWLAGMMLGVGILTSAASNFNCQSDSRDDAGELSAELIPGYVYSDWQDSIGEFDRWQEHFVPELRDGRHLTVFCAPKALRRTESSHQELASYVARVVATTAINEREHQRRIYVGLFGPWSTPDDGTTLLYGAEAVAESPLISPSDDDIAAACSTIGRTFEQSILQPQDHSALLARTALFGWPNPRHIRKLIDDVTPKMVADQFETLTYLTKNHHRFFGKE